MISPYKKRGSAFERLGLQAQGLELLWVEASTPCRGHTGTSTLREESRETGLVASCLRFYSPQPTCRQHSKLIGVKAIKDIFTVFKRSTVLWTCREGKVFWEWLSVPLPETQSSSGRHWGQMGSWITDRKWTVYCIFGGLKRNIWDTLPYTDLGLIFGTSF